MATYTCTQCGHINEAERIYCHNCGAKLDRSILPQEDKKKKEESPEKARKRVMKMVNPASGIFAKHNIKTFFEMIAMGAVVAIVIQAIRPPEARTIPAEIDKVQIINIPQLGDKLEDTMAVPQSHPVVIPENIANGYLQKTIKTKAGDDKGGYLKFERAFVHFDDGIVNMNIKLTLFGWPLYAASYYKLSTNGTALVAENSGGAFGRMPVHPQLMKYADKIFDNLWGALKREKKLLDQMKSVEVKTGEIVFVTNPKAPAAR